jgi:hypothetical protein
MKQTPLVPLVLILAKFNPLYVSVFGGSGMFFFGKFIDRSEVFLSPLIMTTIAIFGTSGFLMTLLRARLISPDGFIQPYGFNEEEAAKKSTQPSLWIFFFLARITTAFCVGVLTGWTALTARQIWG